MPPSEAVDSTVLQPNKRLRSESIVLESPDAKKARGSQGPDTRDKAKKARRGKKRKRKSSITQPSVASGRHDSSRTPKIGALAGPSTIVIDDDEDEEDDEEVLMLVEPIVSGPSKKRPTPDAVEVVDVSQSSDKGKEREVPQPIPDIAKEISTTQLEAQLAEKSQLVDKYQSALTQIQQNITCQICLDLMYKPFALAPCGHLACYSCLVSWFKAPPSNADGPAPSAIARQKTCPHCRAVVRDRPVEVWDIKSLVLTLSKTGLLAVEGGTNGPSDVPMPEDPWKDIFRPVRNPNPIREFWPFMFDHEPAPPAPGAGGPDMGMYDAEDGGVYRCLDCMHEIYLGRCTACNRAYPGHADFNEDDDDDDYPSEGDLDEDDSDGEPLFPPWVHPFVHFVHGIDDDDDEEEAEDENENEYDLHDDFIDDGDDVPVFRGIVHDEDEDEESDHEFRPDIVEIFSDNSEEGESDDELHPRFVEIGSEDESTERNEDGDGNHQDDSEDEFAPRRRRIHILDSDEEEDENNSGEDSSPFIPRRRNTHLVIHSTSSDFEDDGYEDDGSVPGPSSRLRRVMGYPNNELDSEGEDDN